MKNAPTASTTPLSPTLPCPVLTLEDVLPLADLRGLLFAHLPHSAHLSLRRVSRTCRAAVDAFLATLTHVTVRAKEGKSKEFVATSQVDPDNVSFPVPVTSTGEVVGVTASPPGVAAGASADHGRASSRHVAGATLILPRAWGVNRLMAAVAWLVRTCPALHLLDLEEDGWTPLSWAACEGNLDVARPFIEKGADVNAKDDRGWTPLIWAARKGHLDVARLLIEKGADVNAKTDDGSTPFSGAAREGHLDVARLLTEKGADVNAKDEDGWTPLIWVACEGHLDVARLLIEKGVDVNFKDKNGWTPLMRAAAKGHHDIVRLLVDKDADVNAKDKGGNTALFFAQSKDRAEVARYLEPLTAAR